MSFDDPIRVDTHCHVDLHPNDRLLVDELETAQIYTIAVTNAPSVFQHTLELTKETKYIRAALGLHPELIATHGHELYAFLRELPNTRYVGEVGLDFTTNDKDLRQRQVTVFERIVEACGRSGDKILTIHSRRAAAKVIDTVGKQFRGRAILHWFSGSKTDLRRALDYGFFFSVNPAMATSERTLSLIREIPIERILTETDAPFAKVGAVPGTYRDLSFVAEVLASEWQMSPSEVATTILDNFRSLVTFASAPSGDVI